MIPVIEADRDWWSETWDDWDTTYWIGYGQKVWAVHFRDRVLGVKGSYLLPKSWVIL